LGVFLICWLPWHLPRGERERERQVVPAGTNASYGGAGLGRGWQWVDWVTAHYVISTGSELTSRLNCAGDNGNLPGHSTVSPHGIFNAAVAAPRFTFYNHLTVPFASYNRTIFPSMNVNNFLIGVFLIRRVRTRWSTFE